MEIASMEIWAAAIVCQTPDGKVMSSIGMGKSENSAIGAAVKIQPTGNTILSTVTAKHPMTGDPSK